MIIREALLTDIQEIQVVRNAVRENRLSDPALVPDKDVEEYLFHRGKGWVCEEEGRIVGFSIVDLLANNVWALFILPEYEKKGIGRCLHDMMIDWYFARTDQAIWLSTSPKTRAEGFYRNASWEETGVYGKGETKFQMTALRWKAKRG